MLRSGSGSVTRLCKCGAPSDKPTKDRRCRSCRNAYMRAYNARKGIVRNPRVPKSERPNKERVSKPRKVAKPKVFKKSQSGYVSPNYAEVSARIKEIVDRVNERFLNGEPPMPDRTLSEIQVANAFDRADGIVSFHDQGGEKIQKEKAAQKAAFPGMAQSTAVVSRGASIPSTLKIIF